MKTGVLLYYLIPAFCGLAMLILGVVTVVNPKGCIKRELRDDESRVKKIRRGGFVILACGVCTLFVGLVLTNPFQKAREASNRQTSKTQELEQLLESLQKTEQKNDSNGMTDLFDSYTKYTQGVVTENKEYVNEAAGFVFACPEDWQIADGKTKEELLNSSTDRVDPDHQYNTDSLGLEFQTTSSDGMQSMNVLHETNALQTTYDAQQFCELCKKQFEAMDSISDVTCTWDDATMQSFPHNSSWKMLAAVKIQFMVSGIPMNDVVVQLGDGINCLSVTVSSLSEDNTESLMKLFTAYKE